MSLREVVREPDFERDLMLLIPGARLADQVMSAVEWVLARTPEMGFTLDGEIYFLDTPEFSVAEPMSVFYAFDDQTVTLLAIRRASYSSED